MKIEWPDLVFPPINLLNAPRVNMLDHPIFTATVIQPKPVQSTEHSHMAAHDTAKENR